MSCKKSIKSMYKSFVYILFFFLILSCSHAPKVQNLLVLTSTPAKPTFLSFKQKMDSLGYEEGKNIAYFSVSSADEEVIRSEGEGLLQKKPQLLVTFSTIATRAGMAITREHPLPLVFGQVSTLEGIGIKSEEERVKKNVTGVTAAVPVTKQLEFLKRLAPGTRKVLLVYKPDPMPLPLVAQLRKVAPDIGVELVLREIEDAAGLGRLLESLKPGEIDAILQIPDPIGSYNFPPFARNSLRLKVPLGVSLEQNVTNKGALFSYVLGLEEHGKEVAVLVDKVLKGIPFTKLQVEIPRRYFLTLNLETAREIGLAIPPDMLSLADRIIGDNIGR